VRKPILSRYLHVKYLHGGPPTEPCGTSIREALRDFPGNHTRNTRRIKACSVQVRRFFLDYKKLEGKQVQVEKIEPAQKAYPFIEEAVARYAKKFKVTRKRPAGARTR